MPRATFCRVQNLIMNENLEIKYNLVHMQNSIPFINFISFICSFGCMFSFDGCWDRKSKSSALLPVLRTKAKRGPLKFFEESKSLTSLKEEFSTIGVKVSVSYAKSALSCAPKNKLQSFAYHLNKLNFLRPRGSFFRTQSSPQ